LRNRLPAKAVSIVIWGAVLALFLSVLPMQAIRAAVLQKQADALAAWRAEVEAMPADAPLWRWTSLLGRGFNAEDDVIARIRDLDRRQADAEAMLKRGDFPLAYLGRFALDATPAVCEGARRTAKQGRAAGRRGAANATLCRLRATGRRGVIGDAMAARIRLCGRRGIAGLGNDGEALSRAELRRRRTRRAARSCGAGPDAQGLAGKILIAAIPSLDLEATPRLCAAALAHVREDDLDKVYRPTADDPRPYSELLERLGAGEPLTLLQWLAGHGCNAEAELGEAEQIVRSYQDSPERQAMLASLAALHRR